MPQSDEVSILDWLEQQNRFMERDIPIDPKLLDTDDELTAALVGADDMDYDDDDFSDDED